MAGRKEQQYRVGSEWGVVSKKVNQKTGEEIEVRLTKTSWFGKPEKWDLRSWGKDYAGSGVVIGNDAALRKLRDLLIEVCKQIELDDEDDEY